MKASRASSLNRAWTLLEVLASTAILGALLMLMAESLGTAQRSLLSTRKQSFSGTHADTALGTLTQHLQQAVLHTRQEWQSGDGMQAASDQHFVCGPVQELLSGMDDLYGDAVFFQKQGREGALTNLMEGCGFFVRYDVPASDTPARLPGAKQRRCFQLVQCRIPAPALDLSAIPFATQQNGAYAWFRTAARLRRNLSVVTPHVITMTLRPLPADQECYDTRRHQWQGDTPESLASRHRLPNRVEVRLVLVDETDWNRLDEKEADGIASTLRTLVRSQPRGPEGESRLLTWLQSHRLASRVVTASVALTGGTDQP